MYSQADFINFPITRKILSRVQLDCLKLATRRGLPALVDCTAMQLQVQIPFSTVAVKSHIKVRSVFVLPPVNAMHSPRVAFPPIIL